jgi:hypothetical protein
MEGTPAAEPVQQDACAPPTEADTLLLDAQIAEGLNNIDVIRLAELLALCFIWQAAGKHKCKTSHVCLQ